MCNIENLRENMLKRVPIGISEGQRSINLIGDYHLSSNAVSLTWVELLNSVELYIYINVLFKKL